MELAWLGGALMLEGRLDEALQRAQEANALARRHGERGHEAWSLQMLGAIVSRPDAPDFEKAEAHYRAALGLASELGMRPLVAHCHFELGKLFRKSDRPEDSREHLVAATTLYREMDMRAWLDRAEAEMRQLA